MKKPVQPPLIFRPPMEVGQQTNVLKIKLKDNKQEYENGYFQTNITIDSDNENENDLEYEPSSTEIPELLAKHDSSYQQNVLPILAHSRIEESSSILEESFALEEYDLSDLDNKSPLQMDDLALMERFSTMLEESSSALIESTSLGEESSIAGDESTFFAEESSSALEESTSLSEESSYDLYESTSLAEESSSEQDLATLLGIDNSLNDEYLLFDVISSDLDELTSLAEESSSAQDIATFIGINSSLDDEFLLLEESNSDLDESTSLVDESSSAQDIATFIGINNSLNDEDLLLEESNSHLDESFHDVETGSQLDQYPSNLDESSSVENDFSSMLANAYSNEEESDSNEEFYKCEKRKYQSKDCVQNKRLPIVKLPVVVSKLDIDIDIFDELDLLWPISNVTKTKWSIQSLDCVVPLPSTKVFLKGIIVAEIEYVNIDPKQTLHTVKIPILWDKIIDIDWLYHPILSRNNYNKEYTFHTSSHHDMSIHREFYQEFSEQIYHELKSTQFVCHEELVSKTESPKLFIHGSAKLSIELLQPQYIDLNSFNTIFI